MAQRTGVPTLHDLSVKICRALGKFSHIIAAAFPDNAPLQAALAAAIAACAELSTQLALVREYGD